jgi:hypothetical protein
MKYPIVKERRVFRPSRLYASRNLAVRSDAKTAGKLSGALVRVNTLSNIFFGPLKQVRPHTTSALIKNTLSEPRRSPAKT